MMGISLGPRWKGATSQVSNTPWVPLKFLTSRLASSTHPALRFLATHPQTQPTRTEVDFHSLAKIQASS